MSDRLDELWEDRRHWKWGLVYVCEEDPRVVVRKKIGGMGWTFNFAHSASFLLLFLVMMACVAPLLLVMYMSEPSTMQSMTALAVSMMLIVALIIGFSRIGRE